MLGKLEIHIQKTETEYPVSHSVQKSKAGYQWFTLVILATQEAEINRIKV
jgi:hypothetical protein